MRHPHVVLLHGARSACAAPTATLLHMAAGAEAVVKEFHDAMSRSPDMAVAVAAIKALTSALGGGQCS